MNAPTDKNDDAVADAAPFRRVQQANQSQVIGKLLHDLRNPVHSMRIMVELFRRIAAPGADTQALLSRAARYVAPAETALAALSKQAERFASYLGPPAEPAPQSIEVNEQLAEIAVLLRESRRALDVTVESTLGDEVSLLADRPRLSHALLGWCLGAGSASIVLHAREEAGRVRLATGVAMGREHADLCALIERAGGQLERGAENDTAVLFPRAGRE